MSGQYILKIHVVDTVGQQTDKIVILNVDKNNNLQYITDIPISSTNNNTKIKANINS
jgi:hypothetical protein